jgi:chain length determinant protein EpsF
MNFGQFFAILRARWLVALIVFSVVVTSTVVFSLLVTKQYAATATILVDIKPDPIAAINTPPSVLTSLMATQIDILTSDRVAYRTVRDLKLLDDPRLQEQWKTDAEGKGTMLQWLADTLKKQLTITPSRDSAVIQVAYQAPDPRFAAGVANAFAQAYLATTLELRVDPAKQFSSFFIAQSKDARVALEIAQGKLSTFQREKGIIAADERMDIETARLNELSTQLVQIQALTAESSSRQVQAQGAQADRIQEVLTNNLITNMKADLARGEAKLQELSAKFGDSHPQVIEAKASTTELRNRIDLEVRRISGGVAVSNTITKQREADVRRELTAQRVKVQEMKTLREQGMVLVREVDSAQRAYDSVMARRNQVEMEAQAPQSYANILTSAQAPIDPASPKIAVNIALGVFLGLLLGMGSALMLEFTDRRVRGIADLATSLNLPVFGVLPKPSSKRSILSKRARMLQQRVIGLPSPDAVSGA